jgi:signal transduction histidine kinase
MTACLDGARLAILVHEVRSPVAALSAVAETMQEPSADNGMRGELVRLAVAACRGIERIVLDVAVASVRVAPLEVGALVRDAVAAYVVRGANVTAHVADGPLVVDGDQVRLRQVVDNLVANALVHGAGADVTIRVNRTAEAVEIAVSDTGPGIRSDDIARIFEVGIRLSDGTPGSGLGLPLARAIVEAHGGALEIESEPGAGTTFTITLPARASQPAT